MKVIAQKTSSLLAVYIVALQVILGLHSFEHQYTHLQGDHDSVEFIENVFDCTICDLYIQRENQAAIVSVFEHGIPTLISSSVLEFTDDDTVLSFTIDSKHLRGPPTA